MTYLDDDLCPLCVYGRCHHDGDPMTESNPHNDELTAAIHHALDAALVPTGPLKHRIAFLLEERAELLAIRAARDEDAALSKWADEEQAKQEGGAA